MGKDEAVTKEQLNRKPRILIAEDEMIIAADLEYIVSEMGYDSAGIFMSGEEVLQAMKKARPDLVLMDIRLRGELDGIETAAKIRERYDIPVVYLTGYAEEAVLQEAKLTDPFGYVGKPVRERELRATIEMALYRHEMDQKLRESEQRMRLLTDALPACISYVDASQRYRFANKTYEEWFGLTQADIIGKPVVDVLGEDAVARIQHNLDKALSGQAVSYEAELPFRTGGARHIAADLVPNVTADGQVDGFYGLVHDITERRQAEQELRLHSEIVANMAEGVYLVRVSDVVIVYANPTFEEMFGYGLGEMVGKHASIVNAPTEKSPREMADEIMAVLHETGVWRGEVHNIRKDGTPFWCDANVSTFDHPEYGEVLVAVHTDITERKWAEEALRESRTWFSTTLKSIGDAVIATDSEGHVRFMNSVAEALTGWAEDEAAGRSLEEVFHIVNERTGERVESPVTKVMREGEVVGLANHTALIARDGRRLAIADSGAPIRDGRGETTGVVLVFRDVTEQVRAEEEIESLARFPSENRNPVLRVAQDGWILYANEGSMPLLDLWGTQVGRKLPDILQKCAGDALDEDATRSSEVVCGDSVFRLDFAPIVEAGYVNVYGYDVAERREAQEEASYEQGLMRTLLNKVPDYVYFKDRDRRFVRASKSFCDLLKRDLEDIIGNADEDMFPPEVAKETVSDDRRVIETGTPIINKEEGGESIGGEEHWVLTTKLPWYNKQGDIVGLFGISRDITERKKAEEQIKANLAEKEVLLREVHHRVKNSLQVISSLLIFQSDAVDNEEIAQAFQESRNRIQAIARVHEHLYRSEDLTQIDMASYIGELVGYLRQSHWAYGVVPRVEVAGVRLDVDTAMPCGLLINELVCNAMKHAFPTQEEVGPDALRGEVLIALQAEGSELVLTVSDDGAGLPKDVDVETAESLGLRLVEMLTRQLRGTLEVDRGRENGTSFKITFPAPENAGARDSRKTGR